MSVAGADVQLFTSSRYEYSGLPASYRTDTAMTLWPAFGPPTDGSGGVSQLAARLSRTVRRGVRAWRLSVEWWKVVGRIVAFDPDIVQITRDEVNPTAPIVRKRLRSKGVFVVELVHEASNREMRFGSSFESARRWVARIAGQPDAYVTLSEAVRKVVVDQHDLPDAMVRTIPHGASPLPPPDRELVEELRRELGANQRAVLLCFGTLRRSKGIPVLLDAIAKLRTEARPLLVVAGHPTRWVDPLALERQVDLLGIRSSVVFDFRYIPDVELAALLEVSALVVLPYLSATQSGAMHLAIAHGTPVLATSVGGLAEGIHDHVDGRLVPPRDPQALATAIGELIQDPSALATMGERARARYLDERSWARCGRTLVTTYSEWLGGH